MNKDKTWALITGASTGIGRALAFRFAREGYAVALVARHAQRLSDLAKTLRHDYAVSVLTIPTDLSKPDAAQHIFDTLVQNNIALRFLINNAGLGACGSFEHIAPDRDNTVIDVNIRALTALTKLGVQHMRVHGGGKILNVASTGAYQPGPYISVYYASKAYVLSFTQAVRRELKHSGITVCALCPGSTATEFSRRAGKADIRGAMSPEKVADCGFRGLMRGRGVIIPGFFNKVFVFLSKLAPGRLSAAVVAHIQKNLTDAFGA